MLKFHIFEVNVGIKAFISVQFDQVADLKHDLTVFAGLH